MTGEKPRLGERSPVNKRRRRTVEKDEGGREEKRITKPAKGKVEKEEKLSPKFSPLEQKGGGTFAVGKPQAEFESIDGGLKSEQKGISDSRSAKAQFEDREEESKPTIDVEKNSPQPSFREQEEKEAEKEKEISDPTTVEARFEEVEPKRIRKRRPNDRVKDMGIEPSNIDLQLEEKKEGPALLDLEEIEKNPSPITTEKEEGETASEDMEMVAREAGRGSEGEEVMEFPDLVFNMTAGKGDLRSRDPKVILFREWEGDSYVASFETLCKRIYRELEGGEPEAKLITTKLDDYDKQEIEKWVDSNGKFQKRIFDIDIDFTSEEIDKSSFLDRIEELYSQGLGFVILKADTDDQANEVMETLSPLIIGKRKHRPKFFVVSPKNLDQNIQRKISEMTWGFSMIELCGSFDDYFEKGREQYTDTLRNLLVEKGGLFANCTTRNQGQIEGKAGPESDLHYLIKIFILRNLVHDLYGEEKKLRRDDIIDKIKTEEKLGEARLTPDLTKNFGKKEVYEVETLFGTGIDPISEIVERVDEYADKQEMEVRKVNFVLDNFTMIRHLRRLKSAYKQFDKDFDIEISTLDLESGELVTLQKIEEKVREIGRELKTEEGKQASELALQRFEEKQEQEEKG